MKKILLGAALAFLSSFHAQTAFADEAAAPAVEVSGATYVDGNWFQLAGFNAAGESKFGAPGDTNFKALWAQVGEYKKAKEKAEADTDGIDIASREECERLAVRSSVRGQYALEVGRLYMKAGDNVKAKAAYLRAKAWGELAQKADYSTDSEEENAKVAENKTSGAWVVTIANRQLKKL